MNFPYLHSPTSSHWWSRSKSSSKLTKEKPSEASTLSRTYSTLQADAVLDPPPKQSSMFGNFTSVIRLKPKKNVHAIAIQEPPKTPVPLIITPPNSSEPYGPLTSRPYSKAVSAVTVTDEDSVEPTAPLDSNLTYHRPLVDSDPFAATSGVIFSSKESDREQLDRLYDSPDLHVTTGVPASPQTADGQHRTPDPHVSPQRLVSEITGPIRGPAPRSVVFTSSPQFSDRLLTFTSQNTTECAYHTAESTDTEDIHERCSCSESCHLQFYLRHEVCDSRPVEEQSLRRTSPAHSAKGYDR